MAPPTQKPKNSKRVSGKRRRSETKGEEKFVVGSDVVVQTNNSNIWQTYVILSSNIDIVIIIIIIIAQQIRVPQPKSSQLPAFSICVYHHLHWPHPHHPYHYHPHPPHHHHFHHPPHPPPQDKNPLAKVQVWNQQDLILPHRSRTFIWLSSFIFININIANINFMMVRFEPGTPSPLQRLHIDIELKPQSTPSSNIPSWALMLNKIPKISARPIRFHPKPTPLEKNSVHQQVYPQVILNEAFVQCGTLRYDFKYIFIN